MKKFLIFVLIFIACAEAQVVEEQVTTTTIATSAESFPESVQIIPIECIVNRGSEDGCENLYNYQTHKGYINYKDEYCQSTSITFIFDDEYIMDYVIFQNFTDNRFDTSARPKYVHFFGPLDDSMTYGGHVANETLRDTQYQGFFFKDWVPTTEIGLSIYGGGYFTPTKVDYCGFKWIEFYGYKVTSNES